MVVVALKLAMLSPMQTTSSFIRTVGAALLAGLLAACAQNPPAPVEDLSHVVGAPHQATPQPTAATAAPAAVPADSYRVQRGDTLYSIAFRKQIDWRQLAAWNGIIAPYTIHPGSELRLTPPPSYRPVAPEAAVATAPVFQPVEDAPVKSVAATPAPTEPGASVPPVAPVVAPTPPEPTAATVPPVVAVTEAAAATTPVSTGATRRVDAIAWSWPADGSLLDGFRADDPTRQGIDVGGRAGAPVRAAADGVVVYSGNGLVGYGELVIVKHSDVYLSAYGHNRKRFVNEGERVRAGQQIAEMGSSGSSRTGLHFEIRKQGKPVDPMAFLPPR